MDNWFHDLHDTMARVIKAHHFALGGIEMLGNQPDADTFGDIMLAQQLAKVLKILGIIIGCPNDLANQGQNVVFNVDSLIYFLDHGTLHVFVP